MFFSFSFLHRTGNGKPEQNFERMKKSIEALSFSLIPEMCRKTIELTQRIWYFPLHDKKQIIADKKTYLRKQDYMFL